MHMSEVVNRLREDVAGGSIDRAAALGEAKGATDRFFTVPKVIHK
jgi:Asp-tRNA(Asn)/Glu-tRNA(Gln) amidotransferase C subunit